MNILSVPGGQKLDGMVYVSGAKNGALPLLALSLLASDIMYISNLPVLTDTQAMMDLLKHYGMVVDLDTLNNKVSLDPANLANNNRNCYVASKIRASIWLLAPLLVRFGCATLPLPGGDAIGAKGSGVRKIDLHIALLEKMGAKISSANGYIQATLEGKLQATNFIFNKVSVGATINAILACVMAQGVSCIENCAIEPEIVDMCECLIKMGAIIEGVGSRVLKITGVDQLGATEHKVIPDRIEAATYMMMAAITAGRVEIVGIASHMLESFCAKLIAAGAQVEYQNQRILVTGSRSILPVNVSTAPFPGFVTDLQAQFTSLMALCSGSCYIEENLYENRFMHVAELNKMGANITIDGNRANIVGVQSLKGATVYASDIRASVCLLMAGLIASGTTMIKDAYHLSRGYENFIGKLALCGVKVEFILPEEQYQLGAISDVV